MYLFTSLPPHFAWGGGMVKSWVTPSLPTPPPHPWLRQVRPSKYNIFHPMYNKYSLALHIIRVSRTFYVRTKKSRNLAGRGPARLYAARAVCPCKILQCALQIQRTPLCVEWSGEGGSSSYNIAPRLAVQSLQSLGVADRGHTIPTERARGLRSLSPAQ